MKTSAVGALVTGGHDVGADVRARLAARIVASLDRLLQIATRLGERVEVAVRLAPGSDAIETPKPLAKYLKGLRGLCRRFGVRDLPAFGSVLRSDFKPASSDIDLTVEFGRSSRDGPAEQYFHFKDALERQLGRPVDLVELPAMPDSRFKRAVQQGQVTIYEQEG